MLTYLVRDMDDKDVAVDRCEVASTEEVDKKLQWKRDLLLLPILGTMHMILFLDRTNIANARIEGLEAGLNMPPTGYSTALWIFYIPFILAEIPSNLILITGKIKPNLFLGGQMFLLGNLLPSITVFYIKTLRDAGVVLRTDFR